MSQAIGANIPETSENVKIIGAFGIPTISYGGDSISFKGPIDQLFFDVDGWDDIEQKPRGEIPKLYPKFSAFYINVQNGQGKIVKAFIARMDSVLEYWIRPDGTTSIKFQYTEITPAGPTEMLTLLPTIRIIPDATSELVGLLLEGPADACIAYAKNRLQTFRFGGKEYHTVDISRCEIRYDRTMDGEEKFYTAVVMVIAYPEIPAPDITNFQTNLHKFACKEYGGLYERY